MNKQKLECGSIMPITKTKLKKEILLDITKRWEKKCPSCNTTICYKNRRCLQKSIRKKQKCKRCASTGRILGPMSEEHREKIRQHHLLNGTGKWMLGRKLSEDIKNKISFKNSGKIRSEEAKKKYSACKTGDKNPAKRLEVRLKISNTQKLYPRIISEETRRKLSIKAKINMIEKMKMFGELYRPVFNPNACKYFDKFNEEKGWKLQHAMNGGEKRVLCYFLDAYDKNKNTVIEYDESHHYDIYGILKEKDKSRMKDIINYLNCKFYRYNERSLELKEYGLD